MRGQGGAAGEANWRVEVQYDSPAQTQPGDDDDANDALQNGAVQQELITRNNARQFTIRFVDRPIRVLYVEGYPRWEYRYLKNLLIREQSIESSMLLLSADRGFAQEGDVPITRLPTNVEEIEPYDVVMIGDVPADHFTSAQISLLRDHVSGRGAGLLWIGGGRHTPGGYGGTPLADLLPMREPGAVSRLRAHDGSVRLTPTPMARALGVLALRAPTNGADASAGTNWPEQLPALQWAQSLGALKPAAEAVAMTERPGANGARQPIIARLRYGAGQSLYVATDDTWRWRYGRGEWYFQQFWLQLVRMLGRQRVQESGERARLAVSTRRAEMERPVVVELTLRDPALMERQLPQVSVDVHQLSRRSGAGAAETQRDDEAPRVDELELRPVTNEASAEQTSARQRVYRATWRPTDAGTLELRVNEPALDALDLRRRVDVFAPDDELREPRPDHQRLARLASQTGGAVVPVDQLDRLPQLVPNRDRRIPNDVSEPLWDSPLVLIVVLVLLTTEWVLRKLIRLV